MTVEMQSVCVMEILSSIEISASLSPNHKIISVKLIMVVLNLNQITIIDQLQLLSEDSHQYWGKPLSDNLTQCAVLGKATER